MNVIRIALVAALVVALGACSHDKDQQNDQTPQTSGDSSMPATSSTAGSTGDSTMPPTEQQAPTEWPPASSTSPTPASSSTSG